MKPKPAHRWWSQAGANLTNLQQPENLRWRNSWYRTCAEQLNSGARNSSHPLCALRLIATPS
jgi:hypothetical protein